MVRLVALFGSLALACFARDSRRAPCEEEPRLPARPATNLPEGLSLLEAHLRMRGQGDYPGLTDKESALRGVLAAAEFRDGKHLSYWLNRSSGAGIGKWTPRSGKFLFSYPLDYGIAPGEGWFGWVTDETSGHQDDIRSIRRLLRFARMQKAEWRWEWDGEAAIAKGLADGTVRARLRFVRQGIGWKLDSWE